MLEWFGTIDLLKIILAIIGAAGLVVAIRGHVGTRALFSSKLKWGFQTIDGPLRPVPDALVAKDPIASFAFLVAGSFAHAPFHVWISNDSRRKISDVKLELTYPRAHFLDNEEVTALCAEVLEHFPEHSLDMRSIDKLMARREALVVGDMIRVSHMVGTLRPGEGTSFIEMTRVPDDESAFADKRFRDRLFSDVLSRLRDSGVFSGVCHVRGSLLSDLNKPHRKWINVVAVAPGVDADDEGYLSHFVDAHWLGAKPDGASYYKPRLPWQKHTIVEESLVLIIQPGVAIDTKRVGDVLVRVHRMDAATTRSGFATLWMPGYRYFDLPSGLDREAAIAAEGYVPFTPTMRSMAIWKLVLSMIVPIVILLGAILAVELLK